MRKGKPSAWQQSAQWRAISRAAITEWNAKRASLPKCGARRKRDGEPCEIPAMANGRCYIHGGRTGSGANWHVRQWPNGDAPDAEKKLAAKLKRIDRDRRRLERRLAKMTAEERERFDRWQRDHKPGPAAERERRRADRKHAADFRKILDRCEPRPISPELRALQEQAAGLEAERDRLLQIEADRLRRQIENEPIGVFS